METIAATVCEEIFIKKSRFITYAHPANTCQQAAQIVQSLRSEHPFATHICHAYVCEDGTKMSDDGEPSGTAGKPILNVITKSGLSNVLIAVVRYFGGIKLGAGGLTRAYSGCAASIISRADIAIILPATIYSHSFSYNEFNLLTRTFEDSSIQLHQIDYSNGVQLTFAITDQASQQIFAQISKKIQAPFSPTPLKHTSLSFKKQ